MSEIPGPLDVTGLFFYPIKSCGGTALDLAEVGRRGIRFDRELMIVDAASGHFLTQRELPRLALIRPKRTEEAVRLAAPGMPAFELPIVCGGPTRRVVVWSDACRAVDQGDAAARWLGEFLGQEVRLVRMADDFVRRVDSRYARRAQDEVGFADGYPFLLISEESLADLNRRLAEPLPMNRFRPNLVIRGAGVPFVEDRLAAFRIGPVLFHVVKPCARCVTTTTDQATAARGPEPLATLATFRRAPRGVLFGQNLVHEGTGTIRVRDPVGVVAWQAEELAFR